MCETCLSEHPLCILCISDGAVHNMHRGKKGHLKIILSVLATERDSVSTYSRNYKHKRERLPSTTVAMTLKQLWANVARDFLPEQQISIHFPI